QIQRADYEVEIARRRYEASDPANRLVAAELESRWEQALRERERLKREAEELDRAAASPLGAAGRRRGGGMGADPGEGWDGAGADDRDGGPQGAVAFPRPPGVPGWSERGGADPDRDRMAHRGTDTGHGAASGGRGMGPEDIGGRGRADTHAAAFT